MNGIKEQNNFRRITKNGHIQVVNYFDQRILKLFYRQLPKQSYQSNHYSQSVINIYHPVYSNFYSIHAMYTDEIKRRKSNAYFQLKTFASPDDKGKVIEKLGSSIYTSMDTLISLKSRILVADFRELKYLIESFRKEHAAFLTKQKSLFELDQNSDKIDRLKKNVKEFLENFSTDEIEGKLKNLKQEKEEARNSTMNATNQQSQLQQQLLNGKTYKKAMLEEEEKQLKVIAKMMEDVKKVSLDTSSLILGIGEKLHIAETNIQQARKNLQKGNKDLVEVNKYEQDSSKTKILFGSLICLVVFVILLIMIAAHK